MWKLCYQCPNIMLLQSNFTSNYCKKIKGKNVQFNGKSRIFHYCVRYIIFNENLRALITAMDQFGLFLVCSVSMHYITSWCRAGWPQLSAGEGVEVATSTLQIDYAISRRIRVGRHVLVLMYIVAAENGEKRWYTVYEKQTFFVFP